MIGARCDTTELLVDECACREHRGGRTPQEEAAAEDASLRERLLSGADGHHWWAAKYSGRCFGCGQWFPVGAAIRSNDRQNGFIGECCAEGDGDGLW